MSSLNPIRIGVNWRLVGLLIGSVVLALLALRQLQFVDRYCVNLMCWDQWDDYWPMFRGESWWSCFNYQPGPQRQGLGNVVMRCLANASAWNSRWDSFSIAWTLTAAAVAGMALAWSCGMGAVSLIVLPLAFFNVRQYQQLVADANLGHGAMPILLLMLFSLAWFARPDGLRHAIVSVLTFLLIFTGYGLFVGLLAPMILIAEMVQAARIGERRRATSASIAIVVVIFSWLLFAHGYQFGLATLNVKFPWDRPLEYFWFAGVMLANNFGIAGNAGPLAIALGLLIAAALSVIACLHAWRFIRRGVANEPRSVVIFCLAAFALLYVTYTALGRVMLGWAYGAQSRYVTLMIPAGLAILLHLDGLVSGKHWRGDRWALAAFGLLLAAGTTFLHEPDWVYVDWLHNGCRDWKAAYLRTHDVEQAMAASKFEIHSEPQNLRDRIHFLQERRLNLFAEEPG